MPGEDVFALIAAERGRAADMLAGLSDDQWGVPSLCSQWTVREVAAHLIGPFCISSTQFLVGSAVSGGFHRYSVKETRRIAQRPTADIVATLRANATHQFAPPFTGPLAPPDRPGRSHQGHGAPRPEAGRRPEAEHGN